MNFQLNSNFKTFINFHNYLTSCQSIKTSYAVSLFHHYRKRLPMSAIIKRDQKISRTFNTSRQKISDVTDKNVIISSIDCKYAVLAF